MAVLLTLQLKSGYQGILTGRFEVTDEPLSGHQTSETTNDKQT